jgi:hypothetical protein
MKNPHAVALGRLGGRRGGAAGGRARAERLSPRRRREIARAAIAARWNRLPGLLRDLFYGYRFDELALPKDLDLVMQQVLVRGSRTHRAWLLQRFGRAGIRRWIMRKEGRGLSSHEMERWISRRTIQRLLARHPHIALWDAR